MPDRKYPVILPWKAVLSTPKKNSSSAFRGLHPQPTSQENRLLSYPEAVCTLVRMKGPCWVLAPFQPALLVSLWPWDPVLPADAAEQVP